MCRLWSMNACMWLTSSLLWPRGPALPPEEEDEDEDKEESEANAVDLARGNVTSMGSLEGLNICTPAHAFTSVSVLVTVSLTGSTLAGDGDGDGDRD